MTTSVICLDENQMNESNCKAFKLRWSIKECILLAVAMRMSAKFHGMLQISSFIFPNRAILKPAMAFKKRKKKVVEGKF